MTAGFFQGEGTGLAPGEEFHHNRIQLVCSQPDQALQILLKFSTDRGPVPCGSPARNS